MKCKYMEICGTFLSVLLCMLSEHREKQKWSRVARLCRRSVCHVDIPDLNLTRKLLYILSFFPHDLLVLCCFVPDLLCHCLHFSPARVITTSCNWTPLLLLIQSLIYAGFSARLRLTTQNIIQSGIATTYYTPKYVCISYLVIRWGSLS